MYRWDVSKLEPVVAAPHSPDNRKLARECHDVKIDRVYIGSCTGGKSEDFMAAAKLLHRAQRQVKVPTYLVPATQKVRDWDERIHTQTCRHAHTHRQQRVWPKTACALPPKPDSRKDGSVCSINAGPALSPHTLCRSDRC